jgi:hypothetical protein
MRKLFRNEVIQDHVIPIIIIIGWFGLLWIVATMLENA